MRRYIFILLVLSSIWVWAESAGNQPVRVGMLLPLQVDVQQRNWNIDRFADFYTGALLAVYEMQSKEHPIEVYTFDVGKSVQPLSEVLSAGKLDSMDMVIGPAYPQQVHVMADWAKMHEVHTLLPFSSDVPELIQNPYLLQFNPSVAMEADVVAQYIAAQGSDVKCIFVAADSAEIPASVSILQQRIKEEGIHFCYTTIQKIMNDSLYLVLEDSVDNILLMNTERYANIRQVMPQLMRASQGKQLTLLSRYSWQNEKIVLPQLYCSVFIHDGQSDMQCYDSLYQYFVAQPRVLSRPCYDLLGHDMMMYALQTMQALHLSGENWESDDIVGRPYNGVQSNIRFERVIAGGGYYNANIQVIRK